MLKFVSNVIQKLCDLLGGRGGGHQMITLDHRGEGGGHDRPKKDHIIVERSLSHLKLDFDIPLSKSNLCFAMLCSTVVWLSKVLTFGALPFH